MLFTPETEDRIQKEVQRRMQEPPYSDTISILRRIESKSHYLFYLVVFLMVIEGIFNWLIALHII